jgi:hypothetical protein
MQNPFDLWSLSGGHFIILGSRLAPGPGTLDFTIAKEPGSQAGAVLAHPCATRHLNILFGMARRSKTGSYCFASP